MKSVIIIGGGASGLMAAITAAREGALVTVLESMEKPAKKLLMTGNGKCNLTSLDFSRKDCYRSNDPDFWKRVLQQFDYKDTIHFFEDLGLLLHERGSGIYPITDQAASVADRLLLELRRLHVKLKCQEKVTRLEYRSGIWKVYTSSWHYEADAVILACGSKAVPVTGSDGSGYELAVMTGHTITPVFPALVPLKCRESFVKKLAGLRTRADITMTIADTDDSIITAYSEPGELQWTEYGISGIVVFQLSRYAASALNEKKRVKVSIDCLPSIPEEQLFTFLEKRCAMETVSDALTGILPKKMIPVILELCQIKKMTAAATKDKLYQICHCIKHLSLSITGTRSFEQAQVCGGGVSVLEIHPETMESTLHPGLYITGELIDVDGICGGYNLQWAWSTGYIAGKHSAGRSI